MSSRLQSSRLVRLRPVSSRWNSSESTPVRLRELDMEPTSASALASPSLGAHTRRSRPEPSQPERNNIYNLRYSKGGRKRPDPVSPCSWKPGPLLPSPNRSFRPDQKAHTEHLVHRGTLAFGHTGKRSTSPVHRLARFPEAMVGTAGMTPERVSLFQPLDVMRSPTAEGIGQQWLLCTQMARLMGQAGSLQLEEITGMSRSYCRRLENASWRIWAVTQADRAGMHRARVDVSLDTSAEGIVADVLLSNGEALVAISEPPVGDDGPLLSSPAIALRRGLPHIKAPPLLQPAPAPVAAAVEALPQSMATVGPGTTRSKRPVDLPPLEPALPVASLLQQVTMATLAGGAAGSVSRAVAHPLDTLRVLRSASAPTAPVLEAPLLQRVTAAGSSGLHALSAGVQVGLTALLLTTHRSPLTTHHSPSPSPSPGRVRARHGR